MFTGGTDNDHPHIFILIQCFQSIIELLGKRDIEPVHCIGTIKGNDTDIVLFFGQNQIVCHAESSFLLIAHEKITKTIINLLSKYISKMDNVLIPCVATGNASTKYAYLLKDLEIQYFFSRKKSFYSNILFLDTSAL
jgi:hypothetical protein